MARRTLALAILVAAAVLVPSGTSFAAAGELDTSFSGDGVRRIDFGDREGVAGLALDPSGRIVIGGNVDDDVTVARLRPSGFLDPTFSGDGRRRVDLGGDDQLFGIARKGDKLYLAGRRDDAAAIARITSHGELDRTFSRDGKTSLSRAGYSSMVFHAVAPTPDGGAIAVGSATKSTGDAPADALIVRYRPNGKLDKGFSRDGIRFIDRTVGIVAVDVMVVKGGKILVLLDGEDQDSGVLRLRSDGTTDTSYGGGDGLAELPWSWSPAVMAADGRNLIVVADHVAGVLLIRKLRSDGTDAVFSGDGNAEVDDAAIKPTRAGDVVVQADSRIVIAASNGNQQVIRRTSDGAPDPSFDGGQGFIEVGGPETDDLVGIGLDGQGRIVAAGRRGLPGPDQSDQVVYRFESR